MKFAVAVVAVAAALGLALAQAHLDDIDAFDDLDNLDNLDSIATSHRFRRATPPTHCKGSQKYKVILDYNWSARTHPVDYPQNAVFSPTVLASHNEYYNMWAPGSFASPGLQTVAETGAPADLVAEIKASRNAYKYAAAPAPTEDGTTRVTLFVTARGLAKQSYLSAASMLFPSPDWFTGFYNVNMCDERTGRWRRRSSGKLIGWDAGTDSGKTFLSADEATRPRAVIEALSGFPTRGTPFGRYYIVKA